MAWQASLKYRGRSHFLGYHDTPEAAALAYDAKARELFGSFGRYNFPLPGERGLNGQESA